MTELRNVELAANLQALFTVAISDGVSGQALPVLPVVSLQVRYPTETDFSLMSVAQRHLSGGFVVFSGTAANVFPQGLDPLDSVDFRLDISAPGYTSTQINRQVSVSAITPTLTSVPISDYDVDAMLLSAPVLALNVPLSPNPVGLAGSVIDDNDVSSPIAGANVRVIAPSVEPAVISDGRGRYRIDALPVAATVTLEIDDQGDVSTVEHIVDYSTPLNTRIISLNG